MFVGSAISVLIFVHGTIRFPYRQTAALAQSSGAPLSNTVFPGTSLPVIVRAMTVYNRAKSDLVPAAPLNCNVHM